MTGRCAVSLPLGEGAPVGTLGRMRGTPKGWELLRQNEESLPHPRGPIPLVNGKCPEGTKGIGKVARRAG